MNSSEAQQSLLEQLPLALQYPTDQRLETFVGLGAASARLRGIATYAVAQEKLYFTGASGAGKTHVLLALCAEAIGAGHAAMYVPLSKAKGRLRDALEALEDPALLALDGLDAVAGDRQDEIALFDAHNRLHDRGGSVVYAARATPDALPLVLPDLRSRLSQCTHIALHPLDDAGRAEMLRLRAMQRGLLLEDAALDWLLARVGRDPAGLSATFEQLDRASLAAQRKVTVPFLRRVFGAEGR